MKFGKEFRNHLEQTLPEWREKFLRYKPLKKLLKQISVTDEAAGVVLDHDDDDRFSSNACRTLPPAVTVGGSGFCYPAREVQGENMPWVRLEERFVMILVEEVDKFNDFYMDKEEEFIIRLQDLKERIEAVKGTSSRSWIFSCESKFSEEMLDIRKEFVRIHGEMVLLKNYSSLNFAGLVKILKKYDKRTGALLRLPFTQHALHQPFFTTEPLTRLVHECEANLELLFPLEAEVVESNAPNETETSTPEASSSSLREEDTMDMRRSVLAAMAAIEGLRRASSTYNRLSMAYFFQGHDEDDGAGTVTSENSVPNTSVILQTEENDGEDVLSSK